MKQLKKTIDAIIFDMDGTVIYTDHIWINAMEKTLKKRGKTVRDPAIKKAMANIEAGIDLQSGWEIIQKNIHLDDNPQVLAEETGHHAYAQFEKGVNFIKGFQAFAQKLLANQIVLGLATNAPRIAVNAIDKHGSFKRYFGDHMYCIDDVYKGKPSPEIYLYTAKRMNVIPERCIVFEDSLTGFQAAKNAGMKCIGIKTTTNNSFLNDLDHAIEDYDQAVTALLELHNKKYS